MYYQPTIWVENASASLLHFLMRSQGLAKFINKLHFKMKNDPRVDFGIFLFKIAKKLQNDSCTYILTVCTNVYIRGTHFLKAHDLDVTNSTEATFNHWLQQYDDDINEYLDAENQEHLIKLN